MMKYGNPNVINDKKSKTYGEKMLMLLDANINEEHITDDPAYKTISETIMDLTELMVQPPICKHVYTFDGFRFKKALESNVFNAINNKNLSMYAQLERIMVCDSITVMAMNYLSQHWKIIQKMHYLDGIYIRRNTHLFDDPILWDYTISLKPNLIERLKILKLKIMEVISK